MWLANSFSRKKIGVNDIEGHGRPELAASARDSQAVRNLCGDSFVKKAMMALTRCAQWARSCSSWAATGHRRNRGNGPGFAEARGRGWGFIEVWLHKHWQLSGYPGLAISFAIEALPSSPS